jgi:hypothetical protein
MKAPGKGNDLTAVLQRIDSRSPDAFIHSLAEEISRLHGAVAALEGRLAVMETLAAMADRVVADFPDTQPEFPARMEIEAGDSPLDMVGFHELEYDERGKAYRWTGPERHFSFQFFLDRRASAAFSLTYREGFADEPPELLRSFVDGKEVAITVKRAPEGYVASGAMPPRQDGGGTVLTFVVPSVLSPSARGQSDARLLGLKFLKLVVEPAAKTGVTPSYELGQAGNQDKEETQSARDALGKPADKGKLPGLGMRLNK